MRRRVVESKREKRTREQHARATPYRDARTNLLTAEAGTVGGRPVVIPMDYLLLYRQIPARREIARAIVNVGPQMPACFSCCRRISLNSRRITAAVLAVASVAFVACSDDNDNPVGTANNNTTVRFVNATTGGTNLDIA